MLLITLISLLLVNSGFGDNEQICVTLPGEGPSKPCAFPFIHEGVTYNQCAWDENNSVYWCSTKNNDEGESISGGNCGSGCPIPEDDKCMTESDEQCVFPFIFNNVTYYECTWDYSNTAWCSTKVDPSGVHVGGSKGKCGSGCRVKAKYQGEKPKHLSPRKVLYDVLKDILFKDLGIGASIN